MRLALRAGYRVAIANSGDLENLTLQLSIMAPEATPAIAEDVVRGSDVIILAIPLHQYKTLKPEWFAGKVVIDAMNYWPPAEGHIAEFDREASSSEVIAAYLPDAQVVKALNHIAYGELEADAGTGRAMVLAGDDNASKKVVEQFIADIGYDPIDLGNIQDGARQQPDTPLFDTRYTRATLPKMVQ